MWEKIGSLLSWKMLKLDDSNWEIYINFMLFRYLNFHNKRVKTLKK